MLRYICTIYINISLLIKKKKFTSLMNKILNFVPGEGEGRGDGGKNFGKDFESIFQEDLVHFLGLFVSKCFLEYSFKKYFDFKPNLSLDKK